MSERTVLPECTVLYTTTHPPGPPRLRNNTVCLFIIKSYEAGNSVFSRNRYHGSRIQYRYQNESQARGNYIGSGPHRTLEYRLCAVPTGHRKCSDWRIILAPDYTSTEWTEKVYFPNEQWRQSIPANTGSLGYVLYYIDFNRAKINTGENQLTGMCSSQWAIENQYRRNHRYWFWLE